MGAGLEPPTARSIMPIFLVTFTAENHVGIPPTLYELLNLIIIIYI